MARRIDVYFSLISPWAHLGHEAFVGIAAKHGVEIDWRPVPLGGLFKETGGLPLAKRAIEWLGLDPENQDLVKELTEQTAPVTGKDGYVEPHRRGEGYMRDGSGNVGRIKTLLPATESRREAALTTPKDNKKLVKA